MRLNIVMKISKIRRSSRLFRYNVAMEECKHDYKNVLKQILTDTDDYLEFVEICPLCHKVIGYEAQNKPKEEALKGKVANND